MATNLEIANLIDSQITDVVTAGGVSNVNEGNRMKDILNYADQQDALSTKNAATNVSGNAWVLNEDDMASNSATKVPTQRSVKAYVDANTSGGDTVLEWNATVFQSGTSNPSIQVRQIETLVINDIFSNPTDFRDVNFERVSEGVFRLRVRYTSNNATTVNKLSLMFGDAICRVTGSSNGSGSAGSAFFSYKEWTFETRTPAGILSDGLLLGGNGAYINIKLYP